VEIDAARSVAADRRSGGSIEQGAAMRSGEGGERDHDAQDAVGRPENGFIEAR